MKRNYYLQGRKAEILEALKKAEEYSKPEGGETLLQEELVRMRAVVADQSVLLEKMEGLKGKNRFAFSRYLETLGRSGRKGLWLTRIEVREAGKRIILEGSALHAWQVSRFTEELARQEGFAGLTAARLYIQNTGTGRDTVNFILETDPEKAR